MDCGNPNCTCGGLADGGDGECFACDMHAADRPFFGKIYAAQIDSLFSRRPLPTTRDECLAYYDKHLKAQENSTGVAAGGGLVQIYGG